MQAIIANVPVAHAAVFLADIIADRVIGDRLGLLERLDAHSGQHRGQHGGPHGGPDEGPDEGPEVAVEIDLTCYETLSDDEDAEVAEVVLKTSMSMNDILSDLQAQNMLLTCHPTPFSTLWA
jgi:hypothetical protein